MTLTIHTWHLMDWSTLIFLRASLAGGRGWGKEWMVETETV